MPVIKASPVLFGACGAALSFYCLFPRYRSGAISLDALLALAFVPVAVWGFFSALRSFPLFGGDSPIFCLLRRMPLRAAAFAAGVSLGIGAGTAAAHQVSFGMPENTIRGVSGTVRDDPRLLPGGRAMTTLALKMASEPGKASATAHGEITVFFPEESAARLREFGRGAEAYAEGVLRNSAPGASAPSYIFSADALHITRAAPPFERFRTGIRLGLAERFTAPPFGDASWGGLSLALLLGIRDSLDSNIAAMYRDSGCAHILALSGMHLAVLLAVISFLLKKPLGLRPAAVSGAAIILAYCYIVGPLPSLNRAALMYLIGVVAVLGMFKKEPLLLLCMAFLVQLAITPRAGLSLSFILSYLALAGILIAGEPLSVIFKGRIPPAISAPLSASLGAFLATAGVAAWSFGILRPAGVIATLILTPLTMVFMVFSIAWLVLNLASPPASILFSYPLSLLYRIMEKSASASARVPGIAAPPFLVALLSLAAMAAALFFGYRRRAALQRLEPFE